MVGVSKVQRANANYWIEAVAEGGEDYYTKPGESPGCWLGSAARELGLSGEIGRDAYAAALAGRDPKTGERLLNRPAPRTFTDASGRERRLEPVLGFDVRFAAPKSVSLLYALAAEEVREAVLRAHDTAVGEAISYLEERACFVQRGRGGERIERGTGFLAMGFRHRSSRAGDPALHTHVLVANLTRASSDGRWLSLASPRRRSPLFHQAKPAGYVYQAALRAQITAELGLEWGPLRNGYADLERIGREAIEHFSQRRAEIERAMARRGVTSAKAAEVAAYRTRDAKDYGVDPDRQRTEWLARAAEFDLGPGTIAEGLAAATPRNSREITDADLRGALGELEGSRSRFDRRDLLCALAGSLPEGADAAALGAAVERLIGMGEVIEIHTPSSLLEPAIFTTKRLWELEQRFIAAAEGGAEAGAAQVDPDRLAAVLERHSYLGAEQRAMVTRLASGGERIVAVAARPGAGKTTALAAAREAWEIEGHPVIGVASARSASGELSDAGVPATSIASLLIRAEEWESQGVEPLARGTVIVLDEASTVATADAAALAELAEGCGGKLVAIGDPRQIGAIGAGGLFEHLTRRMEPIAMGEIRRQRDPQDRRVVELAHAGRGSDAIDLLRSRGQFSVADTLPDALDALVLDWSERFLAGEDAVMIARRARDVAELNAKGRELLAVGGAQEGPRLQVGVDSFAVGERVITRINSSRVSNRERWRVGAIDEREGAIELVRVGGDGRAVRLGPEELARLAPGGDRAIQHAYALTAYATESKTFDSAFVLLDPGAAREEFLVEVSRSRGPTHLYGAAAEALTDPELGPATREIEDELHELRAASEREGAEHAAAEASMREQIASLSAPELSGRRSELRERLRLAAGRSPAQVQLEALENRIASSRARLEDFGRARAALLEHRRPEGVALKRVEAQISIARRQLDRLELDKESATAEHSIETRPPAALDGGEQLELALIESRFELLRRREVAAERMLPSKMVLECLGERPRDGELLAEWNEGVDAIYAYRHRHGVHTRTAHPLGPLPKSGAARRQWREAERLLGRRQRALGIEPDSSAELAPALER